MLWYRVEDYFYTKSPCERIGEGLFISCGVHCGGGQPVCLLMRRYPRKGWRIVEVCDEWQHQMAYRQFWRKLNGAWVANGLGEHAMGEYIDPFEYTVMPAVRESGGPRGVVLVRLHKPTGQEDIVGRWLDGGDKPEWIDPMTEGLEFGQARRSLHWEMEVI